VWPHTARWTKCALAARLRFPCGSLRKWSVIAVSDTLGAALWDLEFLFEPAAQLARPVFLGGFFRRVARDGRPFASPGDSRRLFPHRQVLVPGAIFGGKK
jgi:hypothetical protein